VIGRYCPACASIVPGESRYCPSCGAALPEHRPPPTWGHHPAFRFQVDPNDPPYRDVRWVQLVVGISCAVFGSFLLLVWGIVSDVTVTSSVFVDVFLLPGSILLGVGVLLALLGLYRTLAPSPR
jgi:hypothetical protein